MEFEFLMDGDEFEFEFEFETDCDESKIGKYFWVIQYNSKCY